MEVPFPHEGVLQKCRPPSGHLYLEGMNVEKYFSSLSDELLALKDRVRYLIQGEHWLTDGEWKESALRTILRRHLPSNVQVGRGFFLSGTYTSKQVDILLHDTAYPVLFQDADLAMVTPDAVRGILEVKSSINSGLKAWQEITEKLILQARHVNTSEPPKLVGLFAYEGPRSHSQIIQLVQRLEHLTTPNPQLGDPVIHLIALGPDYFVRYWKPGERNASAQQGEWRAYHVPRMAFGYFIHNVVQYMTPRSVNGHRNMWFPEQSKNRTLIYPEPTNTAQPG